LSTNLTASIAIKATFRTAIQLNQRTSITTLVAQGRKENRFEFVCLAYAEDFAGIDEVSERRGVIIKE
jgi:hypothetical protein